MIIVPYFLSISLGSLITCKLLKTKDFSLSLTLAIGTALGLGLSGLMTFISLLIIGQYSATVLISLHLVAIVGLLLACFNKADSPWQTSLAYIRRKNWFDYFSIAIFGMLCFGLYTLASKYPFGGWDAWSLWNMKMKFILLGGKEWSHILTENHWHTQPDYPLLLSCINAWLLSLSRQSIQLVPFVTAVLLSTTTAITIFAGLKQFIHKELALLASALLVCNAYYILLSTSQYADILLALYMLCAVVCLFLHIQTQTRGPLIMAAIILGLMTFVKNEGIVISLLIMGLFGLKLLIGLIKNKKWETNIIWFGLGYAAIAIVTACYKLFLTPENPDIVPFTKNVKYEFLNMDGFLLIVQAFFQQLLHPHWSYIWILLIMAFVCFMFRFLNRNNIWATAFIAAYAAVIIMIYMTTVNFDLEWRLTFTLKRIMFYCLPTVLFLTFKVIYEPKKQY